MTISLRYVQNGIKSVMLFFSLVLFWACNNYASENTISKIDIFHAIWQEDVAEVRRLVAAGVDVNYTPCCTDITLDEWPYAEKPLWHAAKAGNLEIVTILLKAGAAIDDNSMGRSALVEVLSFPI